MKKEIPTNFPSDLPDEELVKLIQEYSVGATEASRSAHSSTPSLYWSEMARLGLAEVQNRTINKLNNSIIDLKIEISELKKENTNQSKRNKRLNGLTIFLSVITIVLAIFTVRYADIDYNADKDWQNEQVKELKRQNNNLERIIDLTEMKQINRTDSIIK
ncbi:MAG: hypothetical protein P1P88_01485 [Bacteroidales bacterium]|nr:hypothetical protein [Bacteroidales bacterium]